MSGEYQLPPDADPVAVGEMLQAILADPRHRHRVRLLTPLPRKVRLRLWARGKVDHLCCWLCDHHCWRGAVLIWSACGTWRR